MDVNEEKYCQCSSIYLHKCSVLLLVDKLANGNCLRYHRLLSPVSCSHFLSFTMWTILINSWVISCYSEDANKRRLLRNKVFKDIEKDLHSPVHDRKNYKPTLKLVLVIITLGTFVALFLSPAVYNTEHLSSSITR